MLTPHLGWPTDADYARFAESTVQLLLDFLIGKPVARFHHEQENRVAAPMVTDPRP